MRPTRLGWATIGGSIGLVGAGRLFGIVELYVAGTCVATVLVIAGLWVRSRRIRLQVNRTIRPAQAHVGRTSTVDVTIVNRGRGTPVLRFRDPVSGTRGADLLLSPLGRRESTTVAYRLPTHRRGLVVVGPMTVDVTDPFGLTRAAIQAAPARQATVLPEILSIPPLPRTAGPDPEAGAAANALGRMGEEFAALRPYVVGDDLRRVHWLASARTLDDLVVRQDDVPWQGRISVVLDVRHNAHDGMTLELAVTAAASILQTHAHRGDDTRLLDTGGADTGFGSGSHHLLGSLEHLAVVDRGRGSLSATVERAARAGGGTMVVVTGRISDHDIEAVERAGTEIGARRIVRFDRADRWMTRAGTDVVGARDAFVTAWNAATPNGTERGSRRRSGARVNR